MKKQSDKILPVRNLYKFSSHELLRGLRTNLNIEFESGENPIRHMTWKEIVLQRYLLDILTIELSDGTNVIKLSDIPLDSKFCISNYYVSGVFTSNTITKYLENVFSTIVETYRGTGFSRVMLDKLYFAIIVMYNTIYNDVIYDITDYVGSSKITDFVEIQDNKDLLKSMLAVREAPTKEKHKAIQDSYNVLDKILRDEKLYTNNNVRIGYVSGNVNAKQVRQLLSCRGFITELDGSIFKYPVYNSFVLGMHDIYDLAIESRAGAKSLHISNDAVKESEYFARALQLVTMILEKLVDGDCGTKNYIDWYVNPATSSSKSDLECLVGKRYLNPNTGKEEIITSKDTWLEGQTIKLRSILKCALRDKRTVCLACFGDIGYSVPTHANLGHYCSVELSEKITQSILSTKHEMSSAKANEVRLADTTKEYLNVKENDFYFKDIIKTKKVSYSLVVSQKEAFGLKDLTKDTSINNIDPLRVSRLSYVSILKEYKDANGKDVSEMIYLPIKDANRPGSFSSKFLEFITANIEHLKLTTKGDEYIIPLTRWDIKYPVITLLDIEYNFKVLNKEVSRMFRSMKYKRGAGGELSPDVFLQQLFTKVNSKLSVNVALLEGIVYPFIIRDGVNRDFRLGGYVGQAKCENLAMMKLDDIVANRSLGATYGWGNVLKQGLLSPNVFNGINAIEHPLDVTVKPDEVIRRLQ